MSSVSTIIPAARELNVPDAPKITTTEFIKQVIENISSQIKNVDDELAIAAGGNQDQQVRVCQCVFLLSHSCCVLHSITSLLT